MRTSATNPLRSLNFQRLCWANLLFWTFAFGLIPYLYLHFGGDFLITTGCILAFTVGLIVPGPFNAYIVERFSRKAVFLWSSILQGVCALALLEANLPLIYIYVLSACFGVFFEFAQNALNNTIVNDLLLSSSRTLGDSLLSWFGRFGLPIGWLCVLYLPQLLRQPALTDALLFIPLCLSIFLVFCTKIPLKAPVKVQLISCDRFWRSCGWPLFLMCLVAAGIEGMLLALVLQTPISVTVNDMLFIGAGLLAAFFVRKTVFVEADDRAEMFVGLLLYLAALLLLAQPLSSIHNAAYALFGAGCGLTASRLLMYFLKLSGHCQRGTSQNTFMLGWRIGFAIGWSLVAFCYDGLSASTLYYVGAGVVVGLLCVYLVLVHPWFNKHKDRDFRFKEV